MRLRQMVQSCSVRQDHLENPINCLRDSFHTEVPVQSEALLRREDTGINYNICEIQFGV